MKTLILGSILVIGLTGCSTTNISDMIKAAATDPAAVHFQVTSIYGTVTYERANPGTNAITVGNTGITTK